VFIRKLRRKRLKSGKSTKRERRRKDQGRGEGEGDFKRGAQKDYFAVNPNSIKRFLVEVTSNSGYNLHLKRSLGNATTSNFTSK
jgi:hypothetical protein